MKGEVANEDVLPTMPLKKYLLVAGPSALMATQPILAPLMAFSSEWGSRLDEFILIFVAAATMVILVFLRKPQWIKWFVSTFFIAVMSAGISMMFSPSIYGKFLHAIRFGGGIDITLHRNCRNESECTRQTTGQLFLRTKDYFILRDGLTGNVTEIPSSDVYDYRYKGDARWGR